MGVKRAAIRKKIAELEKQPKSPGLSEQLRVLRTQLAGGAVDWQGRPFASKEAKRAAGQASFKELQKSGGELAGLKWRGFDLTQSVGAGSGSPAIRKFLRTGLKQQQRGILLRAAQAPKTPATKPGAPGNTSVTPKPQRPGTSAGGYTARAGKLYNAGGERITNVAGVDVSKLRKGHGDLLKGGSKEDYRKIRQALRALGISR